MPIRAMLLRSMLACAALAGCAPSGPDASPGRRMADEAVERGRFLATTTCAACHAVDRFDPSPMPDATPLREIVRRYPLDHLEEAFAEGLVTGHPAMPQFTFRASEIDDLIAYLETLKVEP